MRGKSELLCPFCGSNLEGKYNLMAYYLEHWPNLNIQCLRCEKIMKISQLVTPKIRQDKETS